MRIVELLQPDSIVSELSGASKPEILRELAETLAKQHPALSADEVARVLMEREELASTAIGEGVAIPHGKLSQVSEIVACLGRVRGGVDFDSMDGAPTYLFFVLVAPEASTGAHLKALARISRLFKDAAFRARLLEASDGEELFEILAAEDAKF